VRRGRGRAALATALALAATVLACGPASPPGEGAARLAVSAAPAGAEIASVTVTVAPGDGPDFAPFVEALSSTETGWEAFVTGIPAGPARRFVALRALRDRA
jgi:hypothetical protein